MTRDEAIAKLKVALSKYEEIRQALIEFSQDMIDDPALAASFPLPAQAGLFRQADTLWESQECLEGYIDLAESGMDAKQSKRLACPTDSTN